MKNNINLIFDLDGCLIDSTEVQQIAYYESYKEIVGDDKCPPFTLFMEHTGDSLDRVFTKLGLPLEMVDKYKKISSSLINKISVNQELIQLISQYKNNGSKIAICTGKDRKRTNEILQYFHIEKYFDCVVCSDDVTEPKPSKMSIEIAIKKMNVDKNTVVLIGDGYNDYLSAKNANIKFILSRWFNNTTKMHEEMLTVDTVSDLYSCLDSLS